MPVYRTTQVNLHDEQTIDLGIGQPDFALLPVDLMAQAAAHRLGQGDAYLLNYGYEQGDGYCRQALAAFLQPYYRQAQKTAPYEIALQETTDAEHLFLTAGASQALDLICTLFTRPGDVILVEEPTYFLALNIFADHGLQVVSLPTDADGLVVEALEAAIEAHRPALLYTIPTFQNPTGATLSAARRAQLVALSRAHDLLVVADEVYHLLAYTATPPAPLAAYVDIAPILSLGSFSKILAPGLRLGWIQGAPERLDKMVWSGLVHSGGSLNHFTSALVRSVLELDLLEPYLAHLRQTYQARADALCTALAAQIPAAQFAPVAGGFFVWVQLPPVIDTAAIAAHAAAYDVGFQPGVSFSGQDGLHNYLRLSFAFYDIPVLEEGVARLQRAIQPALDAQKIE